MKLTSEDKLHIYFKKQLDSPDKKNSGIRFKQCMMFTKVTILIMA